MNLTGQQLVDFNIITGPIEKDNVQQHGVDLNLIKVQKIVGVGFIPKSGKTSLAERIEISTEQRYFGQQEYRVWELTPGVYDITFAQGCRVPSDQRLEIYQRSSLLRNGSILRSSVFDAGFETENIGTVIAIHVPIFIEYGARVAQIVSDISNVVTNLYDGQWQRDKQRVDHNDSITGSKFQIGD